MSDMAILYTTWPDEERAAAAAETLLDERLIACANMLGTAQSIFRWQGETCREVETVVLFKTGATMTGALRDRIAALHPYDEPAIVQLGVDDAGTAPAFAAWVAGETGGSR